MTTDKTTATTARLALTTHQKHVATHGAQAATLLRRIAGFRTEAAAAQPPLQRLAALRAGRHEVLAEIALGESDSGALDKADAELETAEVQARSSLRGIEVALAGSGRLTREHAELVGQITAASKHTAGLSYHAAVEAAQAKLEPYRVSLAAMGSAYAALLGSCIAAESFADTTATPPRLYVTGGMRATAFSSPLPSLPGFDREAFNFDFSKSVETATAAAVAALAG